MLDTDKALAVLKKLDRFSEVYRRHEFYAVRRTASGDTQEVTIEILDAGSDDRHTRFHVYAEAKDGAYASGNPGGTIEEALAVVHWADLDRPGRAQKP